MLPVKSKKKNKLTADELGIEVKELKVALDGLTFVINKDNDWATEMTPEQLVSIFKADGGVEEMVRHQSRMAR